jgi:type III secretion protein T
VTASAGLAALAGSLAPLGPRAAAAALHGLRLLPVALLCPFLGGPAVPPTVRLALAFGLGACGWAAGGGGAAPDGAGELLLAAARELAVGTAMGLVSAVPVEAARAGGRLVDTLRGATLSELHVAPLRQRESATGDLLAHWTVVLAGSAGGDRLVVAALLGSFRALPAGAPLRLDALLGAGMGASSELAGCALALGAPAAAGVLAAELALALAARALPPLPLPSLAQPARAGAGLLLVATFAAALAGRLTAEVALSARAVAAVAGGARP